jgi:hypothetical protein
MTLAERTTVEPPERVGKYPVVRVLGEGAMGVVYEAFDPVIRQAAGDQDDSAGTDRQRTKRAPRRSRGSRPRPRRRCGLAHPGIASVYEYGEDELVRVHRDGVRERQHACASTSRASTRFAEEDVLVDHDAAARSALGFAHTRKACCTGTSSRPT